MGYLTPLCTDRRFHFSLNDVTATQTGQLDANTCYMMIECFTASITYMLFYPLTCPEKYSLVANTDLLLFLF